MLKIPLVVAHGATDSDLYDVASLLGTNQELEDYVIAGLITPVGLEATTGSLKFGLVAGAAGTGKSYKDDAGAAVSAAFAADEYVRLKPADYPFLPPFVGISLGTAVTNPGSSRTVYLILAKR